MTTFPDPFEENLLNKWNGGERPDILNFHATPSLFLQLQPEKNLVDLADMDFVKNQLFDLSKLVTVNGKIFGPIINPPIGYGITYNKKVFTEAGITKLPTNYTELLEVCATLKQKGFTPFYDGAADAFLLQSVPAVLFGSGMYDDPGFLDRINQNKDSFTNPEFLDGIVGYKELIDKGYFNKDIVTGNYEGMQEAIMSGKTGMVGGGDWLHAPITDKFGKDAVNETLGFFAMGNKFPVVSLYGGVGHACWYVVDTKDAAKIEGAKEFIKYISGTAPYEQYYQEYVNGMSQIPTFKGFETPELISPNLDLKNAMDKEKLTTWFALKLLVSYGPWHVYLQEMVAGRKTPEDVVKQMDKDFAANAKAAGLAGF